MTKIKSLVFITFLSIGLLAKCQDSRMIQPKINGLSFVASNDTVKQHHINPLHKLNANWVSVMPFAFMKSLEESKLYYNNDRQWFGERVEGVKQSIDMMHKNGIKVMLKPQIWIGGGDFTGEISMKTNEDWQAFEKHYLEMLILYAKLAEETRTEMLCIGTELNSFVMNRPAFWRQLISEVREEYSGEITYAENWDKIENVPFWSSLDHIGVDAYFPVSKEKTPILEKVKSKWDSINTTLEALSVKNQAPILFTEFGYRSLDYAGKEPWDSTRIEGQINEEAQAILLKGLMQSLWEQPWFSGGFLWKWFHDPKKYAERQKNRFSVYGKKSEDVIRQTYLKK